MVITSSINVKIAKETEDNPNTVIDFAGIKTSIIIEISRPLATVLLNIPHPPHKYIRILLLPTRHFNGHSFPFSLNRTIKEKTLPRNADSTEMQRPTVMAVERRNQADWYLVMMYGAALLRRGSFAGVRGLQPNAKARTKAEIEDINARRKVTSEAMVPRLGLLYCILYNIIALLQVTRKEITDYRVKVQYLNRRTIFYIIASGNTQFSIRHHPCSTKTADRPFYPKSYNPQAFEIYIRLFTLLLHTPFFFFFAYYYLILFVSLVAGDSLTLHLTL